ncbi:hypothetical protein OAG63_01215, partial [Methylacidiphilales bacterium]|nr:hypothetical protein [Candidatus Methylacidiphilales bacterium]
MASREKILKVGHQVISVLASGLGKLPGTSLSLGPPRRIEKILSPDRVPTKGERLHHLFPARETLRPAAQLYDPPHACFEKPSGARTKPVFVLELPKGRYWGRYFGYVIDQNDTLLADISPTYTAQNQRHDGLNQLKLP